MESSHVFVLNNPYHHNYCLINQLLTEFTDSWYEVNLVSNNVIPKLSSCNRTHPILKKQQFSSQSTTFFRVYLSPKAEKLWNNNKMTLINSMQFVILFRYFKRVMGRRFSLEIDDLGLQKKQFNTTDWYNNFDRKATKKKQNDIQCHLQSS